MLILISKGSLTSPVILREIVFSGLTEAHSIEFLRISQFESKYSLFGLNPSQGSSAKFKITAQPYLFKTLINYAILTKSSPPVKTLPAV